MIVSALTKEQVEQSQQAERDGHGEPRVDAEAEDNRHGAAEQQGQEDHQPGELEQRLDLLPGKRLHLI